MTIFKKLKIRKELEELLENFTSQKHSIAKKLASSRNVYWMYYEPDLHKHIDEINYLKIYHDLKTAIAEIDNLEIIVRHLKSFYKGTIIAYKQEQHDAVANINLRLEQLYDDIHSIIINLSSLNSNYITGEIKETIEILKKVQSRFIVLLNNNGVIVPSLEVSTKELGSSVKVKDVNI